MKRYYVWLIDSYCTIHKVYCKDYKEAKIFCILFGGGLNFHDLIGIERVS